MKYIIYLLSFLIFLILILIYVKISKPIFFKESKKEKIAKKEVLKPFEIDKNYYLPARVLYIKIDFQKFRYQIIYKLIIKGVDKFSLFNIKTILNDLKVHYSLIKGRDIEIYIFFKNLTEANSVLNLFKEYNFNIKIEKIKKRI